MYVVCIYWSRYLRNGAISSHKLNIQIHIRFCVLLIMHVYARFRPPSDSPLAYPRWWCSLISARRARLLRTWKGSCFRRMPGRGTACRSASPMRGRESADHWHADPRRCAWLQWIGPWWALVEFIYKDFTWIFLRIVNAVSRWGKLDRYLAARLMWLINGLRAIYIHCIHFNLRYSVLTYKSTYINLRVK